MIALSKQYLKKRAEMRFWVNVKKSDGCWLWIGRHRTDKGYGRIHFGSRYVMATRFLWETILGRHIPEDYQMLHRCDVPACVNPDHLFVGTRSDNMRDSVSKGRFNSKPRGLKGVSHWGARLSDEQVRQIRKMKSAGVSTTTIMAIYKMCRSNICDIVAKRLWANV